MRKLSALAIVAALAGCSPARMAGFDALVARSDLDVVTISGIPAWYKGPFRVGNATGQVRRIAQTDSIGWGSDGPGSAFQNVELGEAARFGYFEFALERADFGGLLEGRCRYFRTEWRGRIGVVDIAETGEPMQMACAYRIDGTPVGRLDLIADPSKSEAIAERRVGRIAFGEARFAIRSTHAIERTPFATEQPIGYLLESESGRTIAAMELGNGTERRMLIPNAPGDRNAAAAALLTLALFWDPGDVD